MASLELGTRYPDIDYAWRPASYWDPAADPLAALLTNVKGAKRRELIWRHYREGTLGDLPDVLKEAELDEAMVAHLASMGGPAWLGGEFLPAYEEGDVEIARISLASVSCDVICIRAVPVESGIAYRINDEYGADFDFAPRTSEEPLTLGELIDLLDDGTCSSNEEDYGCGLVLEPAIGNYKWSASDEDPSPQSSLEDALDMAAVSSEFYKSIGEHYDRLTRDWYERERRELIEAGRIEPDDD